MSSKVFNLKNLIWFCAIGLAVFSGYYSVFGISKLFSGGSWSIIGMAAMLELSKLVVVTFLHEHFKTLRLLFKTYLVGAAIVLMGITSIGVYGYLTNSYQETAKVVYKTQNEITLLDQKKKLFEEQKLQLDKAVVEKNNRLKSLDQIRLSQQTAYTQQLSQKRGTSGLSKNITSIDKSSEGLSNDISTLTQKSFALSDSISTIEQTKLNLNNETFSSELGPLLYLSRITEIPMDIVVNWFILILVVVFDPLAVSLVLAANHLNYKDKQNKVLQKLSELGQEIDLAYTSPTGEIQKTSTMESNELIQPDVVTIFSNEEPDGVTTDTLIETIAADSVIEEPKQRRKSRKTKDLNKTSESSILSEVSNEDEQKLFYQEEVTSRPPDVSGVSYKRGVSV
jgi:hypothetical protein